MLFVDSKNISYLSTCICVLRTLHRENLSSKHDTKYLGHRLCEDQINNVEIFGQLRTLYMRLKVHVKQIIT